VSRPSCRFPSSACPNASCRGTGALVLRREARLAGEPDGDLRHWAVDRHAYVQYGYPLAAAAVVFGLWVARRWLGRAPCVAVEAFRHLPRARARLVRFDFMQFAFVADHFQYLASIPLIALLVGSGAGLVRAARASGAAPVAVFGSGAGILLVVRAAVASWNRAAVHRDAETLWRGQHRAQPALAVAYSHLGSTLLGQHRLDEAAECFAVATRIDPQYADAYNNLGIVLAEQGRLDEAVARYARRSSFVPAIQSCTTTSASP